MLERLFKLKQNSTNARTEVIAGLTSFMTMAYIIFVNPNILGAAGLSDPVRPQLHPAILTAHKPDAILMPELTRGIVAPTRVSPHGGTPFPT